MAIHDHKKTDSQIQEAVLRELAANTCIAAAEVGVEVHAGVVTLTGTVANWAKKTAAEETAHHVSGVLDVANDIHVKLYAEEPTDTEIATAVRDALKWDVFVPDARIHSTVMDGAVTLSGSVDTSAQSETAERAVKSVAGVRVVVNELAVEPTSVTPESLRTSIRNALDRHADRELSKLQIDIEGSTVTLHGDVQSWREREAVVGAVTGTLGVKKVVDRLRIA